MTCYATEQLEVIMVTIEQTEHVESGLDVVVRGEHGGIICWCYDMASAEMIANAMNNVWKDADGNYGCSGCEPVAV